MINRTHKTGALIAGTLVVLGLGLLFVTTDGCSSAPSADPVMGSQGYRTWSNDIYKSFEHRNRTICIPDGWVAVGAITITEKGVTFPPNITGVLVKRDAFGSKTLTPVGTTYEVLLLYPLTTETKDIKKFAAATQNAFTRVASLFPTDTTPRQHTIIVTAGIAGDTAIETNRIYPDPSAGVSAMTLSPENYRSNQLLLHSIMHLYNRHSPHLTAYQAYQAPFGADDWQEAEATWAELAFDTRPEARLDRLMYLYRVHTAVRTNNFSLIIEPPFNTVSGFSALRQSAIASADYKYLDYQYGHYVVAPLAMVATEMLLRRYAPGETMSMLLINIHNGSGKSLLSELQRVLPDTEVTRAIRWFRGEETIPLELITASSKYYTNN